MNLTLLFALQSSADGRAAIDALYAIFYNELFIGGLAVALVGALFVALFNKRAGMVLAGTTFVVGFVGLMSPYLISVLRFVTSTSAR